MKVCAELKGAETIRPAVDAVDQQVELTGFDLLTGHIYVPVVYFFVQGLALEQLQSSLAVTLRVFPMLTGRLRQRGRRHWVDCGSGGAGALFRVLDVSVHASNSPGRDPDVWKPHLHVLCGSELLARPNTPAPLLIVTASRIRYGHGEDSRRFALSGGDGRSLGADTVKPVRFALGISIPHSIIDGAALTSFVLSWAAHSNGATPVVSEPMHHRAPLLAHASKGAATLAKGRQISCDKYAVMSRLSIARLYLRLALMQRSLETVVVRFSEQELANMKAQALRDLQGTDQWVSTSDALAAHIWRVLSRVKQEGGVQLARLTTIINCRRRLGLADTYFGNAVTSSSVEEPVEGLHAGLGQLALRVREANTRDTAEDLQREAAFLEWAKRTGRTSTVMAHCLIDAILGPADHPCLLLDDASGFTPPDGDTLSFCYSVAVDGDLRSMQLPGLILVVPAPPAGGRGKEARITLTRKQMANLRTPSISRHLHAFNFAPRNPYSRTDKSSRGHIQQDAYTHEDETSSLRLQELSNGTDTSVYPELLAVNRRCTMNNSNKAMARPSLPRNCKRKSMTDNDGDSGVSKKRRRPPTRASPRLRCKACGDTGAELAALPEGKRRYDDGLTALMRAALSADVSSFRKLTRVKTVAWSKLDTYGRNLLHCAAQGGSPAILSTVIESRVVELDAQAGPGGPTALHYCLDRQDAEAASLLLAAGAIPGIFEAETLSEDTFRYPRSPSPPSTPPYNSGALRSSPPHAQEDGPFPVIRGTARTHATLPRELCLKGTARDDMIATLQSALRKAVVAMDERRVPWLDEETQHALYEQWCSSLRPGAMVDACDCDGKWYEASVVAVQQGSPWAVQVRFRCWGRRFDETIPLETLKVLPAFSVVTPWRETIAVGSGVEVLSTTSAGGTAREERKWWDATVQIVDRARRRVLLSVEGRGGAARWCDLDGEEISDIGTHVKPFPLLPNFPRGKEPWVPTHRQELAREAARSCDLVGLLRLIPIVDPHVMLFQYYRCKLSVIQAWPASSRGCDDGNLSPLQGVAAFEGMMRARVEGGQDVVCVTGPQLERSRSQTEDTRRSVMGHVLTEMKEDLFRELLRGFMVR